MINLNDLNGFESSRTIGTSRAGSAGGGVRKCRNVGTESPLCGGPSRKLLRFICAGEMGDTAQTELMLRVLVHVRALARLLH